LAFAFEAVMANEFEGQDFPCDPSQLVPSGPGYTNSAFQSCDVVGATPGSTVVSGGAYISKAFGFSRSHIWRNFGIMFIFIIAYIIIGVTGSEYMNFGASGAATLQFAKTKRAKEVVQENNQVDDIEKQRNESLGTMAADDEKNEKKDIALLTGDSIFTWSDLSYEIPYGNGSRKLLNNLWGWCKPGELTALMGASGAGKTTLLNSLSQRQTVGVITGEMLVDGKQLGIEFRRGTGCSMMILLTAGFCLQQDIHDETATIREALEFSALLRQDRSIPRAEKLAYVDEIIKLLELGPYQDAIVRSLNVDLKKRLTLGVELSAKPSILLFLDEPTSVFPPSLCLTLGPRFAKRLEYCPIFTTTGRSWSSYSVYNSPTFQSPNRTIRSCFRSSPWRTLLLFWLSWSQLRRCREVFCGSRSILPTNHEYR
jgi:ATP-binding cassette, subfamily G (WHITE), member 2, SNQ2